MLPLCIDKPTAQPTPTHQIPPPRRHAPSVLSFQNTRNKSRYHYETASGSMWYRGNSRWVYGDPPLYTFSENVSESAPEPRGLARGRWYDQGLYSLFYSAPGMRGMYRPIMIKDVGVAMHKATPLTLDL